MFLFAQGGNGVGAGSTMPALYSMSFQRLSFSKLQLPKMQAQACETISSVFFICICPSWVARSRSVHVFNFNINLIIPF